MAKKSSCKHRYEWVDIGYGFTWRCIECNSYMPPKKNGRALFDVRYKGMTVSCFDCEVEVKMSDELMQFADKILCGKCRDIWRAKNKNNPMFNEEIAMEAANKMDFDSLVKIMREPTEKEVKEVKKSSFISESEEIPNEWEDPNPIRYDIV